MNMGRKGYEIDERIKKILKKGTKTGKDLQNDIKKELNTNLPKQFEKTFNQALIKLVEAGDVKIVGYDSSKDNRKFKQSFSSDPLIFDSSKRLTRPQIQKLLNELYTNDEAYQSIKKLFKERVIELGDFEKDRWDRLKEWAIYFTLEEINEALSEVCDLNTMKDVILSLDEKEKEELSDLYRFWYAVQDAYPEEGIPLVKKLQQITSERHLIKDKNILGMVIKVDGVCVSLWGLFLLVCKYENQEGVRFWSFPITAKDFDDVRSIGFEWIYGRSTDNYFSLNPSSLVVEKFLVDTEGSWGKEEALREAGFVNRYKREDIDSFFEFTIDIISTYSKEDQEILFGILAKCLSDEVGYLRTFHEFYVKIQKVDYSSRLSAVFGIQES